MTTHIVTKVRMERSNQGSPHEHIEGVCLALGVHYSRRQVVESIRSGDIWQTDAGGRRAVIRPIAVCTHAGCLAAPYITTAADNTTENNLDNLPRC